MLETFDPMTNDENLTPSPRLMTLEELAVFCKIQRHWRGWSQETLAELSGLTVRTIQRVENEEPSSADTRRALARAFGAEDLDIFNKPDVFPTAEEIQAKMAAEKAAFERDYIKLAVTPLDGLKLIRGLQGSGAFGADLVDDDLLKTPEAREAWGAFVDNARDWADFADDASETNRMHAADQFDEQIRDLEHAGISLYFATRSLVRGQGKKAFRFTAVQVVGAPKGQKMTEIAVPRQPQIGI